MTKTTFLTKKIRFSTTEEFIRELEKVEGKIISISDCTPDCTDTKEWKQVFYEV